MWTNPQIRRKQQICSHVLKKFLIENFIFCTVIGIYQIEENFTFCVLSIPITTSLFIFL